MRDSVMHAARWFLLLALASVSFLEGACGGDGDSGPVTVTLLSNAAEDGYVFSGGGYGTNTFITPGDAFTSGTTYEGVRGFVSYDLTPIPPGATILSATMTLYQEAVFGDPYASLGSQLVDHVIYGAVLEAGAYTRPPLHTAIGILSTDATLGPKSLLVTSYVQDDLLSDHPRSQYRVRFAVENDGDMAGDYAVFHGAGTAPTPAERPTLVVTYNP